MDSSFSMDKARIHYQTREFFRALCGFNPNNPFYESTRSMAGLSTQSRHV